MQKSEEAATAKSSSFENKQVYRSYEIVEASGDGNCLFSSVAHGAFFEYLRLWYTDKDAKMLRLSIANFLRAQTVKELIQRRRETEWYIEGDFDEYTQRMRVSTEWGGEPELLMLSHVLGTPIIVFIPSNPNAIKEGVTPIAQYGLDYDRMPITILFVGACHYDALNILSPTSRMSVEANTEVPDTVPLKSPVGHNTELQSSSNGEGSEPATETQREEMLYSREAKVDPLCGFNVDKKALFKVEEIELRESAESADKKEKPNEELVPEVFQEPLNSWGDQVKYERTEGGDGVVVEEYIYECWGSEEESTESGSNEVTAETQADQNQDSQETQGDEDSEDYSEVSMFEVD